MALVKKIYLRGPLISFISNQPGRLHSYDGTQSADQLLSHQGGLPLDFAIGAISSLKLASSQGSINSSGKESRRSSISRYPLRAASAIAVGALLDFGIWAFVYFHLNPDGRTWQLSLCMVLFVLSLLLVAGGVHALP